jgi:hypothetical protein
VKEGNEAVEMMMEEGAWIEVEGMMLVLVGWPLWPQLWRSSNREEGFQHSHELPCPLGLLNVCVYDFKRGVQCELPADILIRLPPKKFSSQDCFLLRLSIQ